MDSLGIQTITMILSLEPLNSSIDSVQQLTVGTADGDDTNLYHI
jgi:hypothetical protein